MKKNNLDETKFIKVVIISCNIDDYTDVTNYFCLLYQIFPTIAEIVAAQTSLLKYLPKSFFCIANPFNVAIAL